MDIDDYVNPFPGLRPFETQEYNLFFGRDGQSDELLRRLQRTRFLAVVGSAGSGKSSLVRAGLLPALYGGMMTGTGWRVAVMRPGHDPVGNLASALADPAALGSEDGSAKTVEALIETDLRRGSLGLVEAVHQARLPPSENLLVVVDQFEELFRYTHTGGDRGEKAAAFVKLLLSATSWAEVSVYVVVTMRSDYLGDCAQFWGLPEAINDGQYLIPRMRRDEQREAITGPARMAGAQMTAPLVNRLLNDMGDSPHQLPILQHALMRTWDYWKQHRRDGEPIDLRHYEAIGTMAEALSRHADEAWDELPDDRSRHIAEKLFKALTEVGEDNRAYRRPTRLGELCAIVGAEEQEAAPVVEVFRREGRSFLMPPAGVPLNAEVVIDISHESLIRNWQRLNGWAGEEAQSARVYRRLAEAAVLHREGAEGLLSDPALQVTLDWSERERPNAAWAARYHPGFEAAAAYLAASRDAREAEQLARLEGEQRELERAHAFAAQQAKAARRLRLSAVALTVLLLLATATGFYAFRLRQAAVAQERRATELWQKAEAYAAELAESLKREEAARKEAEQLRLEMAHALNAAMERQGRRAAPAR